jgi:hypothetical protein
MKKIFTGTWCLSHNRKEVDCQRYAGTLIIDGKNVTIHLVDVPSEMVYGHYESEGRSIATIIGDVVEAETSKSHRVTLINSSFRRSGIPLGGNGFSSLVLKSKYMLWGYHILDHENFTVSHIKLGMQYLERWVNQQGTDVGKPSQWFDGHGNFVPEITYTAPKAITLFEDDTIKLRLKFSGNLSPALFVGVTKLTEFVNLHVEYKEPIDLFEALKQIRKTEQLFSFLISRATKSTHISVNPTGVSDPTYTEGLPYFEFHDPFVHRSEEKEDVIFPKQMLLSFEKLDPVGRNVFEFWFNNYDRLELALKQYFGLVYNQDYYIENQFLDSVMAFEILHRSLFPDHEVPSPKVKKKWETISADLNKNDVTWLASKLNLGHKRTLLSRFEHIAETFPGICVEVFTDPEQAFRQIVTTRNFMVHGECSEETAQLVLATTDLRPAVRKMKLLLQALLLYAYIEDVDWVRNRLKEIQDYKLERDLNKHRPQRIGKR